MVHQLYKFICLLLLTLSILIRPAYAETTVSNLAFSLSLPDDWMEIPQEVLTAAHKELQKQAPNAEIPKYDYGLQLRAKTGLIILTYLFR